MGLRHQDIPSKAMDVAPSTRGLPMPNPVPSAEDMLNVILATGASPGQALGHVAALYGADAMRAHFESAMDAVVEGQDRVVLGILDDVAVAAPDAANAWLGLAIERGRITGWHSADMTVHLDLKGRPWIVSLPGQVSGLSLELLDLSGTGVTHLPFGLCSRGPINLENCRHLVSLPGHFYAGSGLNMKGCSAWDGILPDDAHVGFCLVTDRHPAGISAKSYRAAQGYGYGLDGRENAE